MSKETLSLTIPDVTGFAKSLRAELSAPPSHVEMLGLIARSAGYRNWQHMRARLSDAPAAAPDLKQVDRAARHFDGEARFARWPGKTAVQRLCLWVLWAQLPKEPLTERQISARIDALAAFRDAAQIRRALVEHGMVTRARDGSVYLRREQKPETEGLALIKRILKP
ncbi:DUF2087 domain-containing protein [Pacificoceanicola onchidii]|uniref:DUF2087 domain-containing protein n=1 Tax=Pacificoceanicola onchidii TaxID=2562685 RepID=UPI0010A6406D|nr:DUF2087 domain-containing protein [Pacificoceanicola onchidii]